MNAKQKRLKRLHGTPAQFRDAVVGAIGEISLSEADAALRQYNRDWRKAGKIMKTPPKWIKVTVYLKLDLEDYKQVVRDLVAWFESGFNIKHLYYARYTTLESSTVEISAYTGVNWGVIRKFMLQTKGVLKVEIADRGTGSWAHACAYQAVKRLKPFDKDLPEDDDFLDLIHWMFNMRGLDYVREARAYAFGALRILHKTALESEQNFKIMRDFNTRVKTRQAAVDLVERLNLLGTKQKWVKLQEKAPKAATQSSGGLQSRPKRSSHAVSGKGRGLSRSRSAGSNHR